LAARIPEKLPEHLRHASPHLLDDHRRSAAGVNYSGRRHGRCIPAARHIASALWKAASTDGQHLTSEGYHMLAEELAGQVAGAMTYSQVG
jgi:hypothetical protein